jgi:hypothetical protein
MDAQPESGGQVTGGQPEAGGQVMDEQPDTVAFGPRHRLRWPRHGRRPAVIAAACVLLGCMIALAGAAVQISRRDAAIDALHAELAMARRGIAATARAAAPGYDGVLSAFPGREGGSFALVAFARPPEPGSGPQSSLYEYGLHAQPGQHYGLLAGICGGQYVTSADLADGTANPRGDVTIVAPAAEISPRDPNAWVLVYRLSDGVTVGGVQGPFVGGHPRPFRSAPPC